MAHSFDLDVSFDGDEPDLSEIPADKLEAAVAELPEALQAVAHALLIEKRTMSDVSQALGIRQGELVSRLHRAMLSISMSLTGGEYPTEQ
jgi:DNA-directed RNA polymerase specialized sigma24 family protein